MGKIHVCAEQSKLNEKVDRMSKCNHLELLKIFEIIDDKKRIKEFVCENCYEIFSSCPSDEEVPKTPIHIEDCTICSVKKKKTKFRVVKESWQEKLAEFGSRTRLEEKKRRNSKN